MEGIKAIIFDLDGVLVFTDEYHYRGWKRLADELGIYFDREINHRLRGVSRMESLEIILEQYGGNPLTTVQKETLAQQKNEYYRTLLEEMSPADLSHETRQTLDSLRGKGLLLGIGSSSKNAKFILERIGMENYFDAISDGTNIVNSKPHPEVFLKAAEMLDCAPKNCLVVEDAQAGIEAAVAGGFPSAAMGNAVHCGKATYSLNTFAGLISIIEKY